MAFYVGSVNYVPGIYALPNEASRGAPFFANNTTQGFWAYPGSSFATPGNALETRSILTHGYTAGGYKDSNPWRSVNKTWHSNDTTVYVGEQMAFYSAYSAGTFSDFNGYVHGGGSGLPGWGEGVGGKGTRTTSYSLATGINRTVDVGLAGASPGGPFGYTGNNPAGDGSGITYGSGGGVAGVGSWETSVSRTFFAGAVNQLGQIGYITGGGESTNTDKFNFPTEIMYTTTAAPVNGQHCTAANGGTVNWWSIAGNQRYFQYSNDSWNTWSPSVAICPDGVCKILSTKKGFHYGGTGANVTVPFARFSDATGAIQTSSLSKPSALGEENFQTGQEWGYCLGQYNGQQNNYTFKVTFSNDSMSVLGTGAQPKGHVGMSSALCSSAAASVTMNFM